MSRRCPSLLAPSCVSSVPAVECGMARPQVGVLVGLQVALSRYDLFHAHLFAAHGSDALVPPASAAYSLCYMRWLPTSC
jgi:hypothetical protein